MKISIFLLTLVFIAGCSDSPSGPIFTPLGPAPCTHFGPKKIDVLPITTVTPASASGGDSTINVYVCLLDEFDSQIKSPATFRFELFQHIQHSVNRKGKRLSVWPDIDLMDPAENNNLWQDFLRAYLFNLPLQKTAADNCILHVTCICPAGKRLTADFLIRSTPAPGANGSKATKR